MWNEKSWEWYQQPTTVWRWEEKQPHTSHGMKLKLKQAIYLITICIWNEVLMNHFGFVLYGTSCTTRYMIRTTKWWWQGRRRERQHSNQMPWDDWINSRTMHEQVRAYCVSFVIAISLYCSWRGRYPFAWQSPRQFVVRTSMYVISWNLCSRFDGIILISSQSPLISVRRISFSWLNHSIESI